ncbi:MAG: transcriptional regulator [Actinobacteria bacterium HGW-Actinobacteria-10]|jgi:predicted HTH transcriptional regulator|nr:MAG: transcriptional regulator [Actinobacteria bacterium HGW-Actinobacteria-10]
MDITTLLRSPEGKTLEFKRDLSSHGPIVRTACAFANAAGGILVFGVADDGTILGVPDVLTAEEQIANLLSDSIAPRVLPEIEVHPWRDTNLLAVTVHPGPSRPYRISNASSGRQVYVRVGSTNRAADDSVLAELARTSAHGSYDEQPYLVAGAKLDSALLSQVFAEIGRHPSRAACASMRLTTDYQGATVPTIGGMLLAGADREAHFPDAHVRVGKFCGTDRRAILDSRTFEGGLLGILEDTLAWIDDRTLRPVEVAGKRHRVRPQYPALAVREAVVNAVVHADYGQIGSPLRVALYEDRLEIENPGLLPFGLTVGDILSGASRVRNRVIARVFSELGLIEQWGSGVPRMLEACREAGLPAPLFEEVGFSFRVTLFADERSTPEVDELDAEVLQTLAEHGRLRTAELARAIQRTPRATRTRLQRLAERGLVVEIGSGPTDPNRAYYLREDPATYRVKGSGRED